MEKKEPKRREDELGKWRIVNGKVLTVGSFDTKKDADVWAKWNGFGDGNWAKIIKNPELPT